MKFLAFSNRDNVFDISPVGRDEAAGVIGTVAMTQPPIGESETREGITEIGYAILGRDPTGSIYITDSENRLLEILVNSKYHKDLAAQATWHFMAWALLFLCILSFLGTLALGLNWRGIGLFVFIAALYIASVRCSIQNEVESAVVCTIILVLILLLLPAIKAARERNQRQSAPEHLNPLEVSHGSGSVRKSLTLDW